MWRSVVWGAVSVAMLSAPALADWQRLTKDQSLLALDLPGLTNAREQFQYEQRPDYTSETYYAAQIAAAGNYPRGQFYYTILAPGRMWASLRDLDEQWVRAQAPFLDNRQIRNLQVARGGGSETLRTVRFQVDEADCVGISFVIGSINVRSDLSAGTPQGSVRGYYCAKAETRSATTAFATFSAAFKSGARAARAPRLSRPAPLQRPQLRMPPPQIRRSAAPLSRRHDPLTVRPCLSPWSGRGSPAQ